MMTQEEALKQLKELRDGYVPGSATYMAYTNAIELVEQLKLTTKN